VKILKIKNGFTTNSSGSYEWFPGGLFASSTPAAATEASSTLAAAPEQAGSPQMKGSDWAILTLSLVLGVASLFFLIKELISYRREKIKIKKSGKHKNNKHANHAK
jgi:hypothetical protein